MADEIARVKSSSSRRDDGEAHSSDRHHHRHRDSSRRHRENIDNGAREHGSHSSHRDRKPDEKDRHRDRDDGRHGHRDDRHRSSHHRSSRTQHRHREEERGERKRRHSDEDLDDRQRHGTKKKHGRHHRERDESNYGSSSYKDRNAQGQDGSHAQDKQTTTDIVPTSGSLPYTSHDSYDSEKEVEVAPARTLKRDDWMMGGFGDERHDSEQHPDEFSYFSSLGKARVKPLRPEKPDPEKLKISSRELNTQLREGKTVDEYEVPSSATVAPQYGSPGYQWRMMKLKRTMEAAEQQGRRAEDIALERYASLEDFQQAQAERKFLDDREGRKEKGGEVGRSTPTLQSVTRRNYLLASDRGGADGGDLWRPGSSQAFRRPGESSNLSTPPPAQSRAPRSIGFETPSSKPATPTVIPSIFTPVIQRRTELKSQQPQQGVVLDDGSSDPDRPILTPDQLNKLQAKIMQAELMGSCNLDTLRSEYDSEKARAVAHRSAGDRGGGFAASTSSVVKHNSNSIAVLQDGDRHVQVLPTLDARGRMYDVGSLTTPDSSSTAHTLPSKGKLKSREALEAHDSSSANDSLTLSDLVRQERFSAGPCSLKDMDAQLARNIMSDRQFSTDLDEQDSSVQRYANPKWQTDALKRQFAINDFARTQKALDRCRFCFRDQGCTPPRVTLVSSGYRAYLSIPDREAVTGAEEHLHIVPMQHHLSLLEADDDTWDEMKNFQKCLMQLAAKSGKAVVFYETLTSIRTQQHAVMEAVMVPIEAMHRLPGVFKQSLGEVGSEWSTHRKVIEFSQQRAFRSALVPQLPYFAVTWDYAWRTGYGHVIEDVEKERDADERSGFDVDEMGAGLGPARGKLDRNFARDVIRSVLQDLDAENEQAEAYVRSFAKSKTRSDAEKHSIKAKFKLDWNSVDWTKMIHSGHASVGR